MTAAPDIAKLSLAEEMNFLLTNRIPRQLATRLFGRISRIENRLFARAAIALWRLCADFDLSDAAAERFSSVHACFTRALKPGARPIDPDVRALTSPCDAIVGAGGPIRGDELVQVKGLFYTLGELLRDPALAGRYADGTFVTLRLTASMYHRFHAPYGLTVRDVTFIHGDTWNVNPIALKRVEKLFCRNERAVIECALQGLGAVVTLVPVAAILVAGIRLHCRDEPARVSYGKGEEMGWFEHGSTIIVLAPKGFVLADEAREGAIIRVGRPMMRLP
jgi:phosphatidylserine decarboxylase